MSKEKIEQFPIFVYGTLRSGAARFPIVRPFVEWDGVCFAWLENFQMYDFGHFPCIMPCEGAVPVIGEVLSIIPNKWEECIQTLDRYESNGFLFLRRKHDCYTEVGKPVRCWVYEGNPDILQASRKSLVATNDWLRR